MRYNIMRVGGISATIGGTLLLVMDVLGWFVQPPSVIGLMSTAAPAPWWTVVSLLGTILVLVGLSGLYTRQAGVVGVPGLTGFLAAFAGMALSVGSTWQQPTTWIAGIPVSSLDPWNSTALSLAFAGWAVFGLATLRAGVFSRAAAVLLVIGSVLAFLGFLGLPTVVVLEASIVWLGFSLATSKGVPATRPLLPRGTR